ncbi:GM19484 [Drosophila sechellia]|uniref:GM19484 n=1 Tax=Drosophila sechellia TaxID=7238 RepID=B4I9Q2_DROSE|nr:GM19484 [Drosophila sechellia]
MSRWGKNIVVPLDSLCKEKENTNRPTVARSVGTVGKWGKMGFTSTRTYTMPAIHPMAAAAAAAAAAASPSQSPALHAGSRSQRPVCFGAGAAEAEKVLQIEEYSSAGGHSPDHSAATALWSRGITHAGPFLVGWCWCWGSHAHFRCPGGGRSEAEAGQGRQLRRAEAQIAQEEGSNNASLHALDAWCVLRRLRSRWRWAKRSRLGAAGATVQCLEQAEAEETEGGEEAEAGGAAFAGTGPRPQGCQLPRSGRGRALSHAHQGSDHSQSGAPTG